MYAVLIELNKTLALVGSILIPYQESVPTFIFKFPHRSLVRGGLGQAWQHAVLCASPNFCYLFSRIRSLLCQSFKIDFNLK